jgi:hypothetical protein
LQYVGAVYFVLFTERLFGNVALIDVCELHLPDDLGSMLWSQLSAKKWHFSQKSTLWSNFCKKTSSILSKKRRFFAKLFRKKNIFLILTLVPVQAHFYLPISQLSVKSSFTYVHGHAEMTCIAMLWVKHLRSN